MMDEIRTALITGGADGIGAAIADALLRSGWRVAVVDRDVAPARERAATFPDRMILIEADVRQADAAPVSCAQVVEAWGRLDLLVNNAGVNRISPLETFPLEDWTFVLDVNLTSTLLFMQAAAQHMLPQGRGTIINMASIAAARGVPGRAAYAAAKAAIISLSKSAAVEWAKRGIRVNAVAPGFTETPMVRSVIESGGIALEPMLDRTPMGRLAAPPEIANAVMFLAGEESSFVTGQVLYVDGGFMADYGVPPRQG
jgi:Dehydrogenases with different specificities (related to short-chain alcohol dehydrogenases)